MPLHEVAGDLLDFQGVIVQQCNCLTLKSLGLAKAIDQRFGVNPYAGRVGRSSNAADAATSSLPGTIRLLETASGATVACLFAQYAPGRAGGNSFYTRICRERGILEDAQQRCDWFQQCLELLAARLPDGTRVAFPHGIGCGLAGGNWASYRAMLLQWSDAHPQLHVSVLQLDSK